MNEYHAIAMKLATQEEIETIRNMPLPSMNN